MNTLKNTIDSFNTTPARLAGALLATGMVLSACSGNNEETSAASESQITSTNPRDEVLGSGLPMADASNCQPGIETDQGYCVVAQWDNNAFKNYENASGTVEYVDESGETQEFVIEIGQRVMVACHLDKETIASGQGGWYRVHDSMGEPLADSFVVSNNYENGEVVGEPINVAFDPNVRPCTPEEIPS